MDLCMGVEVVLSDCKDNDSGTDHEYNNEMNESAIGGGQYIEQ